MSLTGLPFDDIRNLIGQLPKVDEQALNLAKMRNEEVAATFGNLGKQAFLCEWLAGWSGKSPNVSRPMLALFAGTHAASAGLENPAREPTIETVTRLAAGGSAVNQVCAVNDIGLKVFDLALQYPVEDISIQDAMDEKGSAATIGFGMEAIAGGIDLLGLGAFGQGSEIANAAISSIVTKKPAREFLPHLEESLVEQCLTKVQAALAIHGGVGAEPLELLRRLGGREHSAIAGAILAARVNHIPVVLDGPSVMAVVLLLQQIDKSICDHCVVATSGNAAESSGSGYTHAVEASGLPIVLDDFGMIGDGAAAAQAIALIKSVAAIHSGVVVQA